MQVTIDGIVQELVVNRLQQERRMITTTLDTWSPASLGRHEVAFQEAVRARVRRQRIIIHSHLTAAAAAAAAPQTKPPPANTPLSPSTTTHIQAPRIRAGHTRDHLMATTQSEKNSCPSSEGNPRTSLPPECFQHSTTYLPTMCWVIELPPESSKSGAMTTPKVIQNQHRSSNLATTVAR